jgi:CHU_C Type IX secretion signal domain
LLISYLFFCLQVEGQITISKPVLGFSAACPSAGFNTFNLSFSFTPVSNIVSPNIFNVELSDATGNFSSPTLLTTSNSITSPVSVNFVMPVTVAGTSYRIRIRSNSPVAISPSSDSFAAYYAIFTMPFTINDNVSNQNFCENFVYALKVDSGTNSPLQYNQLKYKWFRNGALLNGEILPTLNVTQNGNYYVEVDYGNCTNNAYSNIVSMLKVPAPSLLISSENGITEVCPSKGLKLSTNNTTISNQYQWFLNNTLIPSANASIYTANQAGIYRLEITTSQCKLISNNIILTEIDTSGFTTNSEPNIEITEGEQVTISAQGANSYKWIINGIQVANTSSYSTGQAGEIQLIGTVAGCDVSKIFTITVKEKENTSTTIPNTITPNNDNINDTWFLPEAYAFKDNVEIIIFTANNQIIFKEKNYSNNWPTNPIGLNTVYYYRILKNNLKKKVLYL